MVPLTSHSITSPGDAERTLRRRDPAPESLRFVTLKVLQLEREGYKRKIIKRAKDMTRTLLKR